MMFSKILKVVKPWGHEIIWAHTDKYIGKILSIRAGQKLSVQYHEEKDETMYVLSGTGTIYFYKGLEYDSPFTNVPHTFQSLVENATVNIPPMTIHSVLAHTDMIILEASTNHLGDVIRLSDVYGRK
jgi:mannose-6-phosphate isomerase-like protein (cupin superfamily)